MMYDKDGNTIKDGAKVLYRWQDHKTGEDIKRLGQIKYTELQDGRIEYIIAFIDGFKTVDYLSKPFSKRAVDLEVCSDELYKRELQEWASKISKK